MRGHVMLTPPWSAMLAFKTSVFAVKTITTLPELGRETVPPTRDFSVPNTVACHSRKLLVTSIWWLMSPPVTIVEVRMVALPSFSRFV